jgi:hypothetical protein
MLQDGSRSIPDGGCSLQVLSEFGSDAIVMMRLQQKLNTDSAVGSPWDSV